MTTKLPSLATLLAVALVLPLGAEEEGPPTGLPQAPDAVRAAQEGDPPDDLKKHASGSQKLAVEQDELSADVQELIEEQTVEQVIKLLEEVEEIMAEVTGALDETDTGGPTIAAETEIIEKIFEAAKKRSQSQPSGGQGSPSDAMLEMMQRMMGKGPGEGQQPGEGEGQQPGDQGGEGQTGDSDSPNDDLANGGEGKNEERRIPKSSGRAGSELPSEFQKALDAYNKER